MRLTYRFQARGARDVKIDVTRVRRGGNRVVRTWLERGLEPGRHRLSWRGFDRRLRAVDDGRYAFRVGRRGGRMHNAGKVRIRGFIFPVDGSHGTRGEIGSFGAPRVDGRRHMGFDITAGCGTPLRAARAGVVRRAGYDADLYGNYVLINARRSPLNLFYAHMRSPSKAGRGDRVRTGQRIGRVGLTGNADGTPCHLHFEIRVGGRPVDPDPALARWDAWS